MANGRAGNPRTPREIRARIEEMARHGDPGPYILRVIQREFKEEAPTHVRTVQKIAKPFRGKASRERWSASRAEATEAALVLPVLGELIRRRSMDRLSPDLARWIANVRRIAPDMPLHEAYLMADRYLWVEWLRSDPTYLDAYMALELWRSKDAEMEAIARGLIPLDWGLVTRNSPDFEEGAEQ